MNFYEYKFFNRLGGVSKGVFQSLNACYYSGDNLRNIAINRQIICNSFSGKNSLFTVKQIHSDKVFVLDNLDQLDSFEEIEADAIVTKLQNILIGVFTADCVPIIVVDEIEKTIAVCHAGWRGAYSDLLKNTISAMKCNINNIKVFIGPSIQQKSYKINQDFYQKWLEQSSDFEQFFNGEYFDLPGAICYKLTSLGVLIENITNTGVDTFSDENYFSYRRSLIQDQTIQNERNFGRNISVIKIS